METARVKFAVVDCRALRRCDFYARLLSHVSLWDRAMSGYIRLYRSIRRMSIYQEKPFDPFRAWLDLLLEANYAPKIDRHGDRIERGDIHTSERALAERWGWSKTTVRRFLLRLENDGRIVRNPAKKVDHETDHKADQKRTTLRVVNYEQYQKHTRDSGPLGDPKADHKVDQETDTTERIKKEYINKKILRAREAAPVDKLEFPESLDTPTFRKAWSTWVAYREGREIPYRDLREQQETIDANSGFTEQRLVTAMIKAQRNLWKHFYAEAEPVTVAAPKAKRPEHKVFKAQLSPTEKRMVAMAQKPKEKKPA